MFFSKKKEIEQIKPQSSELDAKTEAIIRYAHNYSGFYHRTLTKNFPAFGQASEDYLSAFMELYTITAMGVSLNSPTISESNFYSYVLSSYERMLPNYFESSDEEILKHLLSYIKFSKEYTNKIIKDGFNFSDIPAWWLLYNLDVYKEFNSDYPLISTLGNELTNHYIHIFEETWEYREVNPIDFFA